MLLELQNINKSYSFRGRKRNVLENFSLSVSQSEIVAIMGESGSGKSTLLNIVGGILKADSGKIIFDSVEIKINSRRELDNYRRKHIGFIVQDFALIPDRNVYENVEMPLRIRKVHKDFRKEIIAKTFIELGLDGYEKSFPGMMSGGEQQRVAIARALVSNPDLILADEPTGSLDRENADNIMNILQGLSKNGKTIIVVTHDNAIAERCDRVIKIEKQGKAKSIWEKE